MTATSLQTAPRRTKEPASSTKAPRWVVHKTGVSQYVLGYWRTHGWLTPPGPNRWAIIRPGSGHRFDWHGALGQIDWLRRLQESGRILDREDADAGWRLRRASAEWAVRSDEGGQWLPFANPQTVIALLELGKQITVAKVSTR